MRRWHRVKNNYDAILSEKERLKSEYHIIVTKNDALNVQLVIMEGGINDFEALIS